MNKAVKKKWVAALRSKEYRQGKSRLRTSTKLSDSYCCLGVLCDILEKPKVGGRRWHQPAKGSWYFGENSTQLPFDIREEVELTSGEQTTLIDMNDRGVSFSDIADWIEENL